MKIIFRTSAVLCALLSSIAGCATEPIAPQIAIEDFCSDPRIVAEAQKQDPELVTGPPWCEASRITFRRDGKVTDVAVASVLRGYGFSSDVGFAVTDSIVQLPEGRLVNLGGAAPVPLRPSQVLVRLMQDLEINSSQPAAAVLERFYKPVLELTKRGYCVTYEMRPPFAGEIMQCAGNRAFFGRASYMPGAITWTQASTTACNLVFDSTGRCDIVKQRLSTDESQRAVYLIDAKHTLPADSSSRYERVYFFLDVETGRVTLRGQPSRG